MHCPVCNTKQKYFSSVALSPAKHTCPSCSAKLRINWVGWAFHAAGVLVGAGLAFKALSMEAQGLWHPMDSLKFVAVALPTAVVLLEIGCWKLASWKALPSSAH